MTTSPFTQAPVNPRRIDPGEFLVKIYGVRFQIGMAFQEIELLTHDDPAARVGSLLFPFFGVPAWQWMKLAEAGIEVVKPGEDPDKRGYATLHGELMTPIQTYPVEFSIKFIWTYRGSSRRYPEVKEILMPKKPTEPIAADVPLITEPKPAPDDVKRDFLGNPIKPKPAVSPDAAATDEIKQEMNAAIEQTIDPDNGPTVSDVPMPRQQQKEIHLCKKCGTILQQGQTNLCADCTGYEQMEPAEWHGHTIVLKSLPFAIPAHLKKTHGLDDTTVGAAIFAALGMYLNAALDKLSPIQIWQKIEAYDAKMELDKSFPRNESPEDIPADHVMGQLDPDDEPEPMTLVSMQLEIATIMKAAFPTFDKAANMDLFRAWTHCQTAKQAYEEIGAQNTIDIVKKAIEVERKKLAPNKANNAPEIIVDDKPQPTTPERALAVRPASQNVNLALVPSGDTKWDVMKQQAQVMIASGFMPSSIRTSEQVMTIAMMGEALGLAPIVAINNINVIQGKPTVSPQLMLALIRKSGQLENLEVTDDGMACTVVMKRKGETAHTERFSQQDATQMNLAGKDNWRKQPAVMRKWRAISAACRIVFPDVIWGLYTPEEMDPDISYIEAA